LQESISFLFSRVLAKKRTLPEKRFAKQQHRVKVSVKPKKPKKVNLENARRNSLLQEIAVVHSPEQSFIDSQQHRFRKSCSVRKFGRIIKFPRRKTERETRRNGTLQVILANKSIAIKNVFFGE
jgi:hypothetical protein